MTIIFVIDRYGLKVIILDVTICTWLQRVRSESAKSSVKESREKREEARIDSRQKKKKKKKKKEEGEAKQQIESKHTRSISWILFLL